MKSHHPPTSEMVTAAIKELKDRKGSSLQAIKKYIGLKYEIDADKFNPFIKKFLRSAVADGILTQPKGHGASGSFKLSVKDKTAGLSARKRDSMKRIVALRAKKIIAEKKKKTTKVTGKKPKAKSTIAKPKVTKASAKKMSKSASPVKEAAVIMVKSDMKPAVK